MTQTIQVIGKTGMLGIEMLKAASREGIQVDESYVDIISVCPEDIKAEIVINCSGIASGPEDRPKMVAVNQNGPRRLADACVTAGARLVHISTDAVFNRVGPHAERDHCDPSSAYGRTKMQGEIRDPPHLTVRTSFVGLGRRGILTQLLQTDDIIPASSKFMWNGHAASTVAQYMLMLALRKDITGLIHIPGEFQTRYQLVLRLINIFDLDLSRVTLDDSYVTDRRLISTRWHAIGLPYPPKFDVQLEELYREYQSSANLCSDTSGAEVTSQNMVERSTS